MKINLFFAFFPVLLSVMNTQAQNVDDLPYAEIPEYPATYTPGNILGRMVDGLGFRYYWATEGLRAEDLEYRPSEDGRSVSETLDHIFVLAAAIKITANGDVIKRPGPETPEDFTTLRRETLMAIQSASQSFKQMSPEEVGQLQIVFQRGERTSEVPLWNLINGQIADAINHVGQIVAFRRAAGNPIYPGVNVFMGTRRE